MTNLTKQLTEALEQHAAEQNKHRAFYAERADWYGYNTHSAIEIALERGLEDRGMTEYAYLSARTAAHFGILALEN